MNQALVVSKSKFSRCLPIIKRGTHRVIGRNAKHTHFRATDIFYVIRKVLDFTSPCTTLHARIAKADIPIPNHN